MISADRYAPFRAIADRLDLDALALVPGPNFHRLFGKNFHTNERPLAVVIPRTGPPSAIVPNLELASFALLDFEGDVYDWRDQDGYQPAFEAMAKQAPLARLGVEGQVMRVFVHHAFKKANAGLEIVDAEAEISGLRLRKTPCEIESLEQAILADASWAVLDVKKRSAMRNKARSESCGCFRQADLLMNNAGVDFRETPKEENYEVIHNHDGDRHPNHYLRQAAEEHAPIEESEFAVDVEVHPDTIVHTPLYAAFGVNHASSLN